MAKKLTDVIKSLGEGDAVRYSENQRIDTPLLELYLQGIPSIGKKISLIGKQNVGKSTTLAYFNAALLRTCRQCNTKARRWYSSDGKASAYKCSCGENDFYDALYLDNEFRMTSAFMASRGAPVPGFKIFKKDDTIFKISDRNPEGGRFLVLHCRSVDDMYDIAISELETGDFQVFTCDALNSNPNKKRMDEGKAQPGDQAKRHWEGLRAVNSAQITASVRHGFLPTFFWANHVTVQIGTRFQQSKDIQAGGYGPQFFQDQCISFWRRKINPTECFPSSMSPPNKNIMNQHFFEVSKNVTGMYEGYKGSFIIFVSPFKRSNRGGIFVDGDTWGSVRLFEICSELGLVEKHKKGYTFMGHDFKTEKAVYEWLREDQNMIEARFWVSKIMATPVARAFLKKESTFYNPYLDVKRIEKVEEQVDSIIASVEAEFASSKKSPPEEEPKKRGGKKKGAGKADSDDTKK